MNFAVFDIGFAVTLSRFGGLGAVENGVIVVMVLAGKPAAAGPGATENRAFSAAGGATDVLDSEDLGTSRKREGPDVVEDAVGPDSVKGGEEEKAGPSTVGNSLFPGALPDKTGPAAAKERTVPGSSGEKACPGTVGDRVCPAKVG